MRLKGSLTHYNGVLYSKGFLSLSFHLYVLVRVLHVITLRVFLSQQQQSHFFIFEHARGIVYEY